MDGHDDPPLSRPRPVAPAPRRYDIAELERETDTPTRTIRYYISRGLLAPAYGRGPSATYDVGHLVRLRLIARLKDERRPLDEIRDRLGELTDADVEAELGMQVDAPSDTWRHIRLHPDLELHVRLRPGAGDDPGLVEVVERIVRFATPELDRLRDERRRP